MGWGAGVDIGGGEKGGGGGGVGVQLRRLSCSDRVLVRDSTSEDRGGGLNWRRSSSISKSSCLEKIRVLSSLREDDSACLGSLREDDVVAFWNQDR